MADINHVVLVGRLTRDAELKYTTNGAAVSKFSIAINRRRKVGDQWTDEANFFNVVVWGRVAEAINQYLVKGKQVGVQGELRQSRWEQDGQPRSRVEVHAFNVQLLGGRMDSQSARPAPNGDYAGGDSAGGDSAGGDNAGGDNALPDSEFEDDIPF